MSGDADRYDHPRGSDDYSQAGDLFRLMSASEKTRLIAHLVGALKPVPLAIQQRQVEYFRKADPAYGDGVAKGLGLG
ncbi:MAG: catalase-related domain-containing protein [Porticoccaceae bacterium]